MVEHPTYERHRPARKLKCGSLFSGIGGLDLGFQQAGFETCWQAENNRFCQAVLKTHFPHVPLFSDVRDCGQQNLSRVDVITAGFPCQDVSTVGKRAGLGGEQTSLFFEVIRITRELKPSWLLLENVLGLLHSKAGRDFAVVLSSVAALGYFVSYRVLDSQFFGVPQRRRRVFIVGSLRKGGAAEVLFEPESGSRNNPAGQALGQEPTRTTSLRSEIHRIVSGTLTASPNIVLQALTNQIIKQPVHRGSSAIETSHADRVRTAARLPEGMDCARYRALGNAVTVPVAYWLAKRIKAASLVTDPVIAGGMINA
jgi:DNA (cytosine-5)-methyltransferase 1